jgi:Domain of unknown function (DUF5076)
MTRELPVPPDAAGAKQAIEVFRGWIIDGGLQCSLFPTVWQKTPEVWGMLLADAARHAANAIAEKTGADSAAVFSTIKAALEDELHDPSDEHEGRFTEHRG